MKMKQQLNRRFKGRSCPAFFFLFSSLLAPVICLCTLCLILSLLLSTNCCLSMMMMMLLLLLLLLLFSCDGSISVDPMAFLCFLPIHPFIIYICASCLGMGNGNDGAGCQLWLLSFCYLLLFPFSLVLFSFFSPFFFFSFT
ncbi:non-histone chromosomal protein 6 [Histoplasma ohiense]|nr:non-histone chromosomal protein 6 [Histoplasma ohiense (nom. inval.)]